MLSPAIEAAAPMGQQFSLEYKGTRAQAGDDTDRALKDSGVPVPEEPSASSATADGGPCMKDKIDNLIENYLLGNDNKDFMSDSDKEGHRDSDEMKQKCSEIISMKTLANEKCPAIDSPPPFVQNIPEVCQVKTEGNSASKDRSDGIEVKAEVKEEWPCVEKSSKDGNNSCETTPSSGKGDNYTVDRSKSPSGDSSQNTATTFQTLIEKVLNTSLQTLNKDEGEKTNILELCEQSSHPTKVSPYRTDTTEVKQESVSDDNGVKTPTNSQQRQSSSEDMSISKRKLVCLKDHIERVLERSFNSSKKELDESADPDSNRNHSEEGTKMEVSQTTPGLDSNGFNAQEMVDTVIDQTKVVNKLLSPSKERASKGEVSEQQPGDKSIHNEVENHSSYSSTGNSASNMRRYSERSTWQTGDRMASSSDGTRHTEQMNKALMQGMERLQTHVEETVANLGRKIEQPCKDAETPWKERHDLPPHPGYHPGYQHERHTRPHLPYPMDKARMAYTGQPTHPFQGVCGPRMVNRSPKEMMPAAPYPNNSYYPYQGMIQSPSIPRQLSPRQLIPQQHSPRQPSPSAATHLPNKMSPPGGDSRQMFAPHHHMSPHLTSSHHLPVSLRDGGSHMSMSHPASLRDSVNHVSGQQMLREHGPHGVGQHVPGGHQFAANSHHHQMPGGHQISLRDCQCASCDSRLTRKPDAKEGFTQCSAEYGLLKPGHISSGSPYHHHHHPGSVHQPLIETQMSPHSVQQKHPERDPKVSSAMALGPTPTLTNNSSQQHPFKMPQLYPSNPPISSPREYSRMVSQNSPGAMPQGSPQGGNQPMWKSSDRDNQGNNQPMWKPSERDVHGGNQPMWKSTDREVKQLPHHQKLQQQTNLLPYPPTQQPQPYPHQHTQHNQHLKRDIRGDNCWGKGEAGEIPNHEIHYSPRGESLMKPKEVAPILDLSVKKKEQVKPTGEQPLDLSCRPQKSQSSYEDNLDSHERDRSSLRIGAPYNVANDMKFVSPSRNTFLHQLESSVHKLCRDRKSPASGYRRGSDGTTYPPQQSPHSAESQSPKRAFPQQMRGPEQGINPNYSANNHPPQGPSQGSGHRQIQGHRDGAPYPLTLAPNASKLPPPLMPAVYVPGHSNMPYPNTSQTHSNMPYPNTSQTHRMSELSPRDQGSQIEISGRHHQSPSQGGLLPQQPSPGYHHQHPATSQHPPMQTQPSRHQSHPSIGQNHPTNTTQPPYPQQQQSLYAQSNSHHHQSPQPFQQQPNQQHPPPQQQQSPPPNHQQSPHPHHQQPPHLHNQQPPPPQHQQSPPHQQPQPPHQQPQPPHQQPPHPHNQQPPPTHQQPPHTHNQQPPPPHNQQPPPTHHQQPSHTHNQQPPPPHNQQPPPTHHQQPSHTHNQQPQPPHQQPQPPHQQPQQLSDQSSYLQQNRQDTSSPNSLDGQSRNGAKRSNVSKHEPIQNIIGNHSPSDILYLICRLCGQTYGSPYGFRKHFRNQHGFEPRAEHTIVQTISATKRTLNVPPQVGPYNVQQAASPQQIPQHHPMEPTSEAPVPPRPPAIYVTGPQANHHPGDLTLQQSINIPMGTANTNYKNDQVIGHESSKMDPVLISNESPSPHTLNMKPISVKENSQSSSVRDRTTPSVELCLTSENSRDSSKSEINSASPTEHKRMECPECGQTFQLNDFGLFKRHCRQHGQPKIPQPLGPSEGQLSATEQVSSSRDSCQSEAGADMSTVCKYCNIPFATSLFLLDHILNVHPDKAKPQQQESISSHGDDTDATVTPSIKKIPSELTTVSVSPDSSCEPQSIQDAKVSESYEDREMPILKKQISTTSCSEGDSKNNDEVKESKGDNTIDSHSTKSLDGSVDRQISNDSSSLLENSDDKLCDFSMDNVSYMHKKFCSHRNKRKNSVASADTTTTNKQLKLSSDFVSSAKSPGSVNSPSAYSSNSYDSETSNLMEVSSNEVVDSEIIPEVDGNDDKHSKVLMKIKCSDGIRNKSEARHQLPFVWDRVTRSQAGKNIRRQDYH